MSIRMRSGAAFAFFLLGGKISTAHADLPPAIHWANSFPFGSGLAPSVTMSDYNTLEVHQASPNDSRIWMDDFYSSPRRAWPFARGWYPTLAQAQNGLTVMVNSDNNGGLWYATGYPMISNGYFVYDTLNAGGTINYGRGYFPAVSAIDTTILETHSAGFGLDLWFTLSGIDTSEPPVMTNAHSWTQNFPGVTPFFPKLATSYRQYQDNVSANETYYAVLVFQGTIGSGPLYVAFGTFDQGGAAMTWSAPVNYDTGSHPSVTICHTPGYADTMLEVHEGDNNDLWFNEFPLTPAASASDHSPPSISSYVKGRYDSGVSPSVVCLNDMGIEAHSTAGAQLWSRAFSLGTRTPIQAGPVCSGWNMATGCPQQPGTPAVSGNNGGSRPMPPPPPPPGTVTPCQNVPYCVSCFDTGFTSFFGNYCSTTNAQTAYSSYCAPYGGCDSTCSVELCM